MQQTKKGILIFLTVLVCLVLLATGTYAAFTRHESVKWVVSTIETSNDLRFSSNYLSDCLMSADTYPERLISVNSGTNVVVTVSICNYPQADPTLFNENDISYTLTAKLVKADGSAADIAANIQLNGAALPATLGGQKLPGGETSHLLYQLTIPAADIDKLENVFIQLEATPDNPTVTDGKKLTGRLKIMSTSGAATAWTGTFSNGNVGFSDLDAFNYLISGTAEGTVTLSWSSDVEISPWSVQQLNATLAEGGISFHVGGQGQPTSYLLQFYRIQGMAQTPTITCSFTQG